MLVYNVNYHGAPANAMTWEDLFKERYEVVLCMGAENVSRDFCLFTPCNRYVRPHGPASDRLDGAGISRGIAAHGTRRSLCQSTRSAAGK